MPMDAALDRQHGEADRFACVTPSCEHCEAVKDVAICGRLSADEFSRFTLYRSQVIVSAETTIFREGDPPEFLYSLTIGIISLYKLLPDGRRQVIGFLFPGDVFGLSLDAGYSYSAETVTQAVLCRFPSRRIEDLYEDVPRLEKRVFELALKSLASAQEQMLTLGRKTAREKIATFLMMVSRRTQERGLPASLIHLPMSRTAIADYLGLTIETVSRTFTQLKKDGLIDPRGAQALAIRDMSGLKALAECLG